MKQTEYKSFIKEICIPYGIIARAMVSTQQNEPTGDETWIRAPTAGATATVLRTAQILRTDTVMTTIKSWNTIEHIAESGTKVQKESEKN